MSWLQNDPPVQYAPERDTPTLFSRPEPSSPLPPGGLQRAGGPDAADLLESWLHAYRSVLDFWQMTVRQQQDAMIAAWRGQLTAPGAKPGTQSETPGV